jgi:hypothetical protein
LRTLDRARERGATSLEYAGFVAVSALVVGAVALGIVGGSMPLARGVTSAICTLFTLGQGSCEVPGSADGRLPTEPCVVSADGRQSSVKAGVAVMLGGNESWYVESLSDGTYRVTRGTGGSVGVEGGAGFSLTGVWADETFGLEAGAWASADGVFNGGEVYLLPTQEAVNELMSAHMADVAKDVAVGGESIPILWWQAPNPVRWATDELTDLAGVPSLPSPSETYYEGGVSAEASASATFIAANAQAGVGVQGLLGVRQGADGTTTTYYAATLSGDVSAGVRGGDGGGDIVHATAGASGELEGVIEIDRDKDGNVTEVVVKYVATGTAYAGEDPSDDGTRWEHTMALPVATAADRQVASAFLDAMNMGPVPGLPAYVPNPTVVPNPMDPTVVVQAVDVALASVDFGRAVAQSGYQSRQSFTANDDEYGGTFDAAWIAKIGIGANVTVSSLVSDQAEYFNGDDWVPWEGCAA